MNKYGWKTGFADFAKKDAQSIGEALEQLREDNNGQLTPTAIVRAAKPASSPLHSVFPWDDREAARIARELIAQKLIRAITVVVTRANGKPIDTRAFVSTKTAEKERHYTSHEVAMDDPEGRAYLVREAWLKLLSWRRQYADIVELVEIHNAIDAAAIARKAG